MTDQEETPNVVTDCRHDTLGRGIEKVAGAVTTRYYLEGERVGG